MRNLAACALEPGPRFNVFPGNNGQGKTNLLEALYVVGTLRSFRTARLAELIRFGDDEAYVAARVERGDLERIFELTLARAVAGGRLDGKAVRPLAKYFGQFNVVLFAPEDLLVPRGSPGERRRFLDRAVFNQRAGYLLAPRITTRFSAAQRPPLCTSTLAHAAAKACSRSTTCSSRACRKVIAARLGFLDDLAPCRRVRRHHPIGLPARPATSGGERGAASAAELASELLAASQS